MSQFDYVILGGGCAGLSLAYELDTQGKLDGKTLAIVEPRTRYYRDKTWSFWRVSPHNFDDCVVGRWDRFSVETAQETRVVHCPATPYETVDSGLFYEKVLSRLTRNKAVQFVTELNQEDRGDALIFNSVPPHRRDPNNTWQHFKGIEIKAARGAFDPSTVTLMDFRCDQRGHVHFYYVLPFSDHHALVETTWMGPLSVGADDYDDQLSNYLASTYQVDTFDKVYEESGAIPMFPIDTPHAPNMIHIGGVGGMTRLSTGYAFLNIQEHSRYLRQNLDRLKTVPTFRIGGRYRMLDSIFLKVLERNPSIMPSVFERFFSGDASDSIPFLSNTGSLGGDLSTILRVPKGPFMKAAIGI